jgi:PilZ domain
MQEERRRTKRIRTLKSGKIELGSKMSELDCIVRNLSPDGALLLVSSLAVPESFQLRVPMSRARHQCHVVWRAHDRVGVAFRAAS